MKPFLLIAAMMLIWASAHAQTVLPSPDGTMTADDAQSPVGLGATLGWERRVVPHRWAPLRVTVIGRERAVAGTVRVELRQWGAEITRIEAPFVATPGAVTPVHLVVPIVGGWIQSLDVRLLDERGRRLTGLYYDDTTILASFSQSAGDIVLLGVVGPSSVRGVASIDIEQGESAGDGERRLPGDFLGVISVRPEDLPPDAMAYDALDALVVHASETRRIDDRARAAVLDWVRGGGRLVFVLDRPGDAHRAWLPESVRPAEMIQHASGATYRPVRVSESATNSGWRSFDTVTQDGLPAPEWMAEGPVGFGKMIVLGADPQWLSPGDDTSAAWETTLSGAVGERLIALQESGYFRGYGWSPTETSLVFDILAESLNSAASLPFALVLVFGAALALAIGPVDRLVFGRLRMLQRTWLTGAAWITVFSIAAYAMPSLVRSGETQFRRVRVIDAVPAEGIAASTGATAIFSGEQGVRALTGDAAGSHWHAILASGAGGDALKGAITLDQGPGAGGGAVPGPMQMNVWTFRTLLDASLESEDVPSVRIERDESVEPARYVVLVDGLQDGAPGRGGLLMKDGWRPIGSWTPINGGWRAEAGDTGAPLSEWAPPDSDDGRRWRVRSSSGPLRPGHAVMIGAAARRGEAMRDRVESGGWGMLALRMDDAQPDVTLAGAADVRHWVFLRVLAPVETTP